MTTSRRATHQLAVESTLPQDSQGRSVEALPVPGLTLAWHPEVGRVGERVVLYELMAGREVEVSRLSPRFASPDSEPYPLADRFLSRRPLRLIPLPSAGQSPRVRSLGVRLEKADSGLSVEIDGEPMEAEAVEIGEEALQRGVTLVLAGRVVLILHLVVELSPQAPPSYGLVGESCALVRLRREIQRVAGLDIPILLRGATGTGKELVASAIHRHGPRRDGPYLAVNMAAIPPTLAAAELFGAATTADSVYVDCWESYLDKVD